MNCECYCLCLKCICHLSLDCFKSFSKTKTEPTNELAPPVVDRQPSSVNNTLFKGSKTISNKKTELSNTLAPPVVPNQPAQGNEPYAFVLDPVSGQITSGSSAASSIGTFNPVSGKITFRKS